jgi:two-component system C4-dicarboxylate transport response regulator DctD
MSKRVLVVDDDSAVREALGQTLELAEFTPVLAGSFVAAKDLIGPAFDGVILSDIRMPGRDGFHLLTYAQDKDPDLPVVLLTGEGDIPMAVRAMGQGAFDFLEKPCAASDLLPVLERALRTRALVLENRALRVKVEQDGHKADPQMGLAEQMAQVERSILETALRRSDGRVSAAAEALRLPRKTFYDKLARHGIRAEAFRTD